MGADAREPRKKALNVALGCAVGALFLALAFRHVRLDELTLALEEIRWPWLGLAVLVSVLIQVFRAWRWQVELRPLERVPFFRVWVVTSVSYMAINLLPARLGEVARPWLMARKSSVSFANVVGNLVVEKTLDSLVLVFYILLGLLTTANLPVWVRHGAIVPAVATAVLVVFVWLLWAHGEAFFESRVLRRLPEKPAAAVRRIVSAIVEGMRILPDTRLLLTALVLSIALWSLPIVSSYLMIRAFAFDVPFSAAVMIFIFVGLGAAIPNAPGMVGTFQWACILALEMFQVDRARALAYGLVLNGVQLLTLVAQGLIALPLAGVTMGEVMRGKDSAGR